MQKRFFGWEGQNGNKYPVVYYDELPTMAHSGKHTVDTSSFIEVPEKYAAKTIDELAAIYPCKEENKDEEKPVSTD